jgi:hypothetical protein
MPFYTYSGSWRNIKKAWVYVNNVWQPIKKGWVWVSNQWKLFFTGENAPSIEQQVTISQSSPNSTTGLITLIGRNFHWTNFTSLTYFFEWSTDGGSNWTTLSTGNINNPASGTWTTPEPEHLVTVAQTFPNIDNLYRFRVFAQNITLNNSSTSSSTTISTPRNVTNVSASQIGSTLQANVSFTTGLYTNSVRITRNEYAIDTLVSTQTFDRTTASPASITLPSYNRTYKFTVKPYTGSIVSSSVTGYPGNETAETAGLAIGAPPAPIPITRPTLSPTGSVVSGTQLTATNGTYEAGSYHSISTRVFGWAISPTPTNGSTSSPGNNLTSQPLQTYTPSQVYTGYTFYAVDIVVSADQSATYYYYSNLSATTFIPSFSDNFDRANTNGSQGIGRTSTGNWFWSQPLNIYGFQNPSNQDLDNISWEIDNNTAYNAHTVPFDAGPEGYPMKTINVADSNVSINASVTDGGGGPGLAFWVTQSGSWWAVAPSYTFSQSTTTCSSGCGNYSTIGECNGCPYTSSTNTFYTCGGSAAGSCPGSSTNIYNASTLGQRCSSCTGVSDCFGTSTVYSSTSSCNGCSFTTETNYYQSCPTPTTSSPTYSDNTLSTACGGKCSCLGPFTSPSTTTYSCGTTETALGSPVVVVATCNATNVGSPCNQRIVREDGFTVYYVRYCVSTTTPGSTYYHCTTRSCSDGYRCSPRSYDIWSTVSSFDVTLYNCCPNSTTTNTYTSRIRILAASGSSVIAKSNHTIATSNSSYQLIRGLSVDTSGNTITAKAYSNTNLSSQLGTTLTYNATSDNPTKMVAGDSAVGIINTPTDANRITGNRLDNFTYTNV